jgi:uncharacterized membrane protein
MRLSRWPVYAAAAVILLGFLISIFCLPFVPDLVASHWNAQGEVDGFTNKFWGLFLTPLISLALFSFLLLVPYLDPLRKNIERFKPQYDGFLLIIISFLFYIHILTIVWNAGMWDLTFRFSFVAALCPAFAVLLYYLGVLTGKAKKNWFIGIRTPWTMSDERVWDATHRLGGRLYKWSALLVLFGILFEGAAFFLILIAIAGTSCYLFIHSYLLYRRLPAAKKRRKTKV